MNIPKIKLPKTANKASSPHLPRIKRRRTGAVQVNVSKILILSILAILMSLVVVWIVIKIAGGDASPVDILKGSLGSIFAMLFAVIFLDNINAYNDKRKRKREERKAIVRHNKIVQPIIDMYLVRKNMVITLNEKNVRKFQVNSVFTIKDMKDMYSPSDLISDVGKSKIEMYAYYQDQLNEKFTHLVEDIDFDFYSELCDAAMEYINATSYGSSALNAVLSYQNTLSGTKSMKSVVLNLIREEPENGKFVDAQPALKNVYLVHQMINDQEKALAKYLKHVQEIIREDEKEEGGRSAADPDHE